MRPALATEICSRGLLLRQVFGDSRSPDPGGFWVVNFPSLMNQDQADILKSYTVYCLVKALSRMSITLLFILVMCPFRSC